MWHGNLLHLDSGIGVNELLKLRSGMVQLNHGRDKLHQLRVGDILGRSWSDIVWGMLFVLGRHVPIIERVVEL